MNIFLCRNEIEVEPKMMIETVLLAHFNRNELEEVCEYS